MLFQHYLRFEVSIDSRAPELWFCGQNSLTMAIKKGVHWAEQLEQIQAIPSSRRQLRTKSNNAIKIISDVEWKVQQLRTKFSAENYAVEKKVKKQYSIADLERKVLRRRNDISIERRIIEKQAEELSNLTKQLENIRLMTMTSTKSIAAAEEDHHDQVKTINTDIISMRMDMIQWKLQLISDMSASEEDSQSSIGTIGSDKENKQATLKKEESHRTVMNKSSSLLKDLDECPQKDDDESLPPPPLSYTAFAPVIDEASLQQPCFLLYETPTHKLYLCY